MAKRKQVPSVSVYACEKGTRVRRKKGWTREGLTGVLLSIPVWICDGWWVMILWDGDERPKTTKVAALEAEV